MQKYLKNSIVIALMITIACTVLTLIYYMCGMVLPNFISFFGNMLIIILSILGIVICNSIFILATDSLFCRDQKFKKRFFYLSKSLWLSQVLLLPISLILLILNIFVSMDISIINSIVVFSISYLSQLVLFFSYKFITNRDWNTTIKVVSSQFMLTLLLTLLLKFI